MKRMRYVLALLALALSVAVCGIFFGCNGNLPDPPAVENVKITAEGDGYGKAGALHKVTYDVPDGCEVTTSVRLGQAPATAQDMAYRDGGYLFYTAGEYTVTVYATKDGVTGSGSATVTIAAGSAFVGNVEIVAAGGETYGLAGAVHLLKYTVADGSDVEVTIEKEGVAAADAVYDASARALMFEGAGQYTVTVTATLGTTTASGSAQITVSALAAPTVTFSAGASSVQEDGEVTLTRSAVYAPGDEADTESVAVLYRRGASGNYADADEEDFDLAGEKFVPHVAGQWKLVYTAAGKSGASAQAEAILTCTAAAMALSAKTAERNRIQTGVATDVEYLASGAVEKYDVSFHTNGNDNVTAVKGDGYAVRVTAEEDDYFTVTVVYTHKVTTSRTYTLDLDFYSVENLTYSPAFGEDPFGGMPAEVLTCMGHLLYLDAYSCGGVARTLTPADAAYEVIENNVTASAGGTGVDIMYAANDVAYPYVIVSNFDDCVATGNFTLKMTLTDPATGYSAVATKKFTVTPTTSVDGTAASTIRNYVAKNDFYDMGDMSYTDMAKDCRLNMVLTKNGTIMHRRNESWPLQNDSGTSSDADFCRIPYAANTENSRLDFKFRLLGANPASGEVWLGIGMRTVNQNGWAGFFDLHLAGGKFAVTCGLDSAPKSEYKTDGAFPEVASGAAFDVRIDRMVNGDNVEYFILIKAAGAEEYSEVYRCLYQKSTSAGNPGAPVAQYQFTHRNAGGCYLVENVSAIDLG